MINKKDITEIAKKMMRKHQGLRDPQIIHPRRDWIIGVFLSLVAFAGIAWWSGVSYLNYSNISVIESVELADTSVVYKEGQVNAALELFKEQTDNYNQLLQNRVRYVPTIVEEEVVATTTENATSSATTTEEIVVTE